MRKWSVVVLWLSLAGAGLAQMTWTEATSSAGWAPRVGHKAVVWGPVYAGIWVTGGGDGGRVYNDVWHSEDGAAWTQATTSAPWTARNGHTSLSFGGRIWVIGGWDAGAGSRNDVWYSSDGVSWTQATNSAGWTPRYDHTSVIAGNRIWVLGGFETGSGRHNDVWYSTDGDSWTEATPWAPWSQRDNHASVFFNNKIWVLGGYDGSSYLNDVWYSSDGVNWTCATASAAWSRRNGLAAVAVGNKMFVLGGGYFDGTSHYYNDVWYSSDGVNWIQANVHATWSGRKLPASVTLNNRIWVLGGLGSGMTYLNDVWSSGLVGIEEDVNLPTSCYSTLADAQPSPFKMSTRIVYTLTKAAAVKLNIYNRTGQEVRGLFDGRQVAGSQEAEWDGRDSDGRCLPGGIYFVRLQAGEFIATKKLVKTE